MERDLWIDEGHGTILDAQASVFATFCHTANALKADIVQKTFYLRKDRPAKTIDLKGNILRYALHQLRGRHGHLILVH